MGMMSGDSYISWVFKPLSLIHAW